MSRRTRAIGLFATAGALGTVLAVAAPPATAEPAWRVVASGLNSPRSLTVSDDGDIYVAESGKGGSGPCAEHPALGRACLGLTGSITRVDPDGADERVVTGLPSLAGKTEAIGPMDVLVGRHDRYVASIGLGASDKVRSAYGAAGKDLGTLVKGRLDSDEHRAFADVVANEVATNPDRTDIDSNPAGIARSGRGFVVADAGGNAILRASKNGRFRTVTALPPAAKKADSVPTAVVRGPDDAWYVSELTGFPFTKGASRIWRIEDGTAKVYATGLTNVTDLAFDCNGKLYAVQIAANGLTSGSAGSLVRVRAGASSHPTVLGGLVAPYGIAIDDETAYVSVRTLSMNGGGQVIEVPLG
jgi:sugar lactone lactonase YvrE